MLEIQGATAADWGSIWPLFQQVVAGGDTYAYAPDTSQEQAHSLWMPAGASAYVAREQGEVVGTYLLRPNQPGLGSHVCNAAFMVKPGQSGRGVGRAMGLHALAEAKAAGYEAMQFNFVVSSNARAVALWESLGFRIVGTIPKAFRHRELGLVDAYVMHRFLD